VDGLIRISLPLNNMKNRLKSFSEYIGESSISENLKYHIDNSISITEFVFRPGSSSHVELLKEARFLYENGHLKLDENDLGLFRDTDLGKTGIYKGTVVPLDLVLESDLVNEAKYQGKEVELNLPKRNPNVGSKYVVYVNDPSKKGENKVKKITFGDKKGGLKARVSNAEARKSFAARHKCSTKKDRTTAGYWACRINKYAHLWGGKTYPGYW
jgi:hypothetical protein